MNFVDESPRAGSVKVSSIETGDVGRGVSSTKNYEYSESPFESSF